MSMTISWKQGDVEGKMSIGDDQTLDDIIAELILPALKAYGYQISGTLEEVDLDNETVIDREELYQLYNELSELKAGTISQEIENGEGE